ncbi:MAG: rhamnulokinase [Clostridia bacterium]|nr:rhamnulokinase [Clostridia bacterium]
MRHLAIDLGASGGRLMEGTFDGSKLELTERHRFLNQPVMLPDGFHWDILRIFHEIGEGILKASHAESGKMKASLGVDTWGVDYGWVDRKGALIGNPYHYRDTRTIGSLDALAKVFAPGQIYRETGIQQLELNTLNQLLAETQTHPEILQDDRKLLFIPDLLNYFLTGIMRREYTISSTSSFCKVGSAEPSALIFNKLGFKKEWLSPSIEPGTELGSVRREIGEESGSEISVCAVASHDTASAVMAVPFDDGHEGDVYISSGTWSLIGTELKESIVSDASRAFNLTNEGGFGRTVRFLRNVMGLWILQESRRQWQREGKDYSFSELSELCSTAKPLASFIDPDDPSFAAPGNMPERIRVYCQKTGQKEPEDVASTVRCIIDSLALKYRETIEKIADVTGKNPSKIHVVGGGVQDRLLCQATADACGLPVVAGPVEATACGNILAQMLTFKEIASLEEARQVVRNSFDPAYYSPGANREQYQEAYDRFQKVTGKNI